MKYLKAFLFMILLVSAVVYAVETRLTGYETTDSAVTITPGGADPSASVAVVTSGINGLLPSEGSQMLEIVWTNETDLKVEVKHEWSTLTFDLLGNERILYDVYIPDAVAPGQCGIWDNLFGGYHAQLYGIPTGTWATISTDVSAQNETGLTRIAAMSFESMAATSGTIYIDNIRLANFTTPAASTDDEYLDAVQKSTFDYFWTFAHPCGMARESYTHNRNTVTAGGTGMGLASIVVGADRGFVTRQAAAQRVLKILTFLEDTAGRYHGAWSHWINGNTGATITFATYQDNGADLVETAFLVEGMLVALQYFNGTDAVETEIRTRATRLWEEVEWDWFLRRSESGYENNETLYWHWSPDYGWALNHAVKGYNEAQIMYVLAIASPTYSIPASCYYNGWASNAGYTNENSYYGIRLLVGAYSSRLFFTHYSNFGLDPRFGSDGYTNYFRNSRNMALIHQEYSIDNPSGYTGYGADCWGLTSSTGPTGYGGWNPENDSGTIAPTAALSSMPYTPSESMLALRHYYDDFGTNLWGEFGLRDAFNETENWYSNAWLAIDQGPIAPMIENYRTGLCWDMFMVNPEIQPALDAIGFINDPYDNMVVNTGFEEGGNGSFSTVTIPGWTKYGTSGWIHNDAGEKLGDHGMKAWSSNTGAYQDISITADEDYVVGGYLCSFTREKLTAGQAFVKAEWLDGSSGTLRTDTVGTYVATVDPYDQWKYVDAALTAPSNAATLRVVLGLENSSGVAQFDGISVVQTTSSGDTTPPAAPTSLVAAAGDGSVSLDWADNGESDLASYNVYRDTASGGPYTQIATGLSSSDYVDNSVTNGTTYYYVVTAVDTSSNESGNSNEDSATPQETDPPTPNPATFASAPAAVSDTEITMTATTGTDASGPVEYYFDETSGNPGGSDSGWTTNPVYTDTGLNPSTTYTYTVTMRDALGNTGTASAPANATTNASGPTVVSFSATEDAYVKQKKPTTNYGSSKDLRVRSNSTRQIDSYLKFVVSGVGSVSNATLRVYSDNVNMGVDVFEAAGTAWSEGSITWNTAPGTTGSSLDNVSVTTGWTEFDVTSAVNGDGTYSFVLKGDANATGRDFLSSESAYIPELVITYQ